MISVFILAILAHMGSQELSDRSMNNLIGLSDELYELVIETYDTCEQKFIVIDGVRTVEKQIEYFASGASQTLDSKHLTGHAIDFIPEPFTSWDDIEAFQTIGQCFKDNSNNIIYGGDWITLKDYGHIEIK